MRTEIAGVDVLPIIQKDNRYKKYGITDKEMTNIEVGAINSGLLSKIVNCIVGEKKHFPEHVMEEVTRIEDLLITVASIDSTNFVPISEHILKNDTRITNERRKDMKEILDSANGNFEIINAELRKGEIGIQDAAEQAEAVLQLLSGFGGESRLATSNMVSRIRSAMKESAYIGNTKGHITH